MLVKLKKDINWEGKGVKKPGTKLGKSVATRGWSESDHPSSVGENTHVGEIKKGHKLEGKGGQKTRYEAREIRRHWEGAESLYLHLENILSPIFIQ